MIKRNIKGQFAKGNLSGVRFTSQSSKGNQHALGNPPNKTSFKVGTPQNQHPNWKGGIQTMTRDGIYINTGVKQRTRQSRLIYTKHKGQIPKGYIIYHLDGNHFNDNINNLQAINRAELLKRNQH